MIRFVSIAFLLTGITLAITPAGAQAFEPSFFAGSRDATQRFMGGTEVLSLVPHKGVLYAGVGYWEDVPGADPSPGAQILRKDGEEFPWRVETRFGRKFLRVDSLKSLHIERDHTGADMDPPVNLLIAGLSDNIPPYRDSAWVRDDNTGDWSLSKTWPIDEEQTGPRSFIVHRDKVTGRDLVFAGAHDSVYRALYNSDTGRLFWVTTPELVSDYRTMTFVRANGDLYVSIADALYRRIDGPAAQWEPVWQWEGGARFNQLRGLAAIPNPNGPGEVLLGAREIQENWMVLIDPAQDHSVTVELDVRAALETMWSGNVNWTIPAYNDIVPAIDDRTGQTVHLISLQAAHPDPVFNGPRAFYLIRHPDATYQLGTVYACEVELPGTPAELRAVRTIVHSPFAAAADPWVYLGGFDANFQEAHNTGWIYRAPLSLMISGQPACSGE